jgi:hypothetical protein
MACALLSLPALASCTYIDRARTAGDMMVTASQFYKLEALVQADVERRRLRSARCYSPLLTPATISGAAVDARLGEPWVDELLRDCPQFAAFLSELTIRRGRSAALPASHGLFGEDSPASIWTFPDTAVESTIE